MNQTINNGWNRLAAAIACLALCSRAFAEEHGGEAAPTGVLGSLGLDPRTVIVQALAFLILLWALKRFLWGPVLAVIADRKDEIRSTYKEAEDAQAKADAARADYEARLAKADEESRERIAQALAQANAMKDEILAGAREQSERIIVAGRESVRQEMEKAQVQIRESATRMAVDLAGRIIQKNIDAPAQQALIDQFIDGAGRPQ